ncbi:MAG TPA: UDP-3-O-(3-hydroxymyristoyl)glucosamine N-acyltransferase [candidate division WOR-3 bacterium]|uniref:UDP-3-O-acylglucosamine N-acyltransferase n=1 Tax=candidate division WOR-3 bacterium TaxID=2052148 RepID=A0A9C9ELB8_UNCW3|nr:UDP-3-O-(3-hydroxymyristoyl)glucosamine N-acyltransferase [candidate division WOR-3 bacterium]
MRLSEVQKIVKGELYGKKNFIIKKIAPHEYAKKNELTFLFNPEYKTDAGAVIAAEKIKHKSGIVVKEPKRAMYILLKFLAEKKKKKQISPLAIIGRNVSIPKNCTIDPFVVINDDVRIGAGTYIGAYSYIEEKVSIGKNCEIHPHTTIYRNTRLGNFVVVNSHSVIGKEGFGYFKQRRYKRIRHIGGVVIKDFVEIGGNVTIDRATIGDTVIGEGTKIDNLVHIAHNVVIGKNCILMGQVGIAGSTKIGDDVILCGQVGISDHLTIGDNVVVYAKSAVFKSIPGRERYSGIPARRHDTVLRALARLYQKYEED